MTEQKKVGQKERKKECKKGQKRSLVVAAVTLWANSSPKTNELEYFVWFTCHFLCIHLLKQTFYWFISVKPYLQSTRDPLSVLCNVFLHPHYYPGEVFVQIFIKEETPVLLSTTMSFCIPKEPFRQSLFLPWCLFCWDLVQLWHMAPSLLINFD